LFIDKINSVAPLPPLRIITGDDHTIVRTGLQMLLEMKFGITGMIEARSCAEVLSAIKHQHPTHLIIDLSFKDGNSIEILPFITSISPHLKIMVYSMLRADVYANILTKLGIRYYLNKESTRKKTIETLYSFLYSDDEKALSSEHVTQSDNPFKRLSARELEVLHYLIMGKTTGFIATSLNLHKNSVSTFKSRIMEKTGMTSMKDLITLAALYDYN
jgi:DNA-binding NarL/FixJ family response regulator